MANENMMNKTVDYHFRVAVIGEQWSGRKSLIRRYIGKDLDEPIRSGMGKIHDFHVLGDKV